MVSKVRDEPSRIYEAFGARAASLVLSIPITGSMDRIRLAGRIGIQAFDTPPGQLPTMGESKIPTVVCLVHERPVIWIYGWTHQNVPRGTLLPIHTLDTWAYAHGLKTGVNQFKGRYAQTYERDLEAGYGCVDIMGSLPLAPYPIKSLCKSETERRKNQRPSPEGIRDQRSRVVSTKSSARSVQSNYARRRDDAGRI